MDSRYLHSLLEVIRTGSIAGAARSLNLTSAAVGQRIKALEQILNTDLLIRTGHKAKPTEACTYLLPQMREIVRKCQDLEFGWDQAGLSGILRVGAISTALTGVMSPAIKAIRKSYPQMQIHLFPGSSKELHGQVLAGDLDLAVIVAPPKEIEKTLVMTPHHEERLIFVTADVTVTNPVQALRREPFISYDPSSWGGLIIQRYLTRMDIAVQTISVLDSPEAIAALVGEGIGVSILPHWIGFETYAGALRKVPLPGGAGKRIISTISRRDSPRSNKIDVFKAAMNEFQNG